MTIIQQLTKEIYIAIDKFEKETGIIITTIEQKHEVVNGEAVVCDRQIKTAILRQN